MPKCCLEEFVQDLHQMFTMSPQRRKLRIMRLKGPEMDALSELVMNALKKDNRYRLQRETIEGMLPFKELMHALKLRKLGIKEKRLALLQTPTRFFTGLDKILCSICHCK